MDDENLEYNVYITEEQDNIETIETVEVIDVSDTEARVIDTDIAFPALGESNEDLQHSLLNGRELSDQHPITAITGLRDELDLIESLKPVYSNEKQVADYFEWEDGNVLKENRFGYFVSLCDDIQKIKIYSEGEVFGVVVNNAAFVGGQDDIARDHRYGLIACSGVVCVRCETNVNVGDFILPNTHGFAKKSDNNYGCCVISLQQIDGNIYAVILLDASMNQMDSLGLQIKTLDERVEHVEKNVISAINVANQAYKKAGESDSVSEEAIKNALEALNKANCAVDDVGRLETDVESANKTAEQATSIANTAVISAEAIRSEAVQSANKANENVNNLVKELTPITSWYDVETGNTGAEYLTTYIKDGLATKAEIQTVETMTNDNKSAILKNAEGIQTMVSSVDMYSVGEYSQANGLTKEQAESILKIGMIYIPTESHSETSYVDQPREFTPGYYYVWGGNTWIESTAPLVTFSAVEPSGSSVLQYWYIDSNIAPEGYEPYALYIWEDEKWKQVNILDGNVNNRITSLVKQTADEVSAEVTNARGGAGNLSIRLTDIDATIESSTHWAKGKSEDGEEVYNIATIKQTADDGGSSLALVVADKEGNKVLKGSSIILGQDGSDSYIYLDSDNIHLEGYTTINKSFTIDESGYMTAIGGTIGGWNIDASKLENKFYDSDNDVTRHIFMQSQNNSTYTAIGVCQANGDYTETDTENWNYQFYLTNDGYLFAKNADIEGKITATDGTIGGWNISPSRLQYKTDTSWLLLHPSGENLWCSDGDFRDLSIAVGSPSSIKFGVTPTGSLFASDAKITNAVYTDGTIYGSKISGSIFEADPEKDGKNLITLDESGLKIPYTNFTGEASTRGYSLMTSSGYEIYEEIIPFHGASYFNRLKATPEEIYFLQRDTKTVSYGNGGITYNFLGNFGNILSIEQTMNLLNRDAGICYLNGCSNTPEDGYSNGLNIYGGRVIIGTYYNDYGTYYDPEFLAHYIWMQDNTARLCGANWTTPASISVDSDRNLKKDIDSIDSKYLDFFKKLRPVTYRYIDGNSGRIHVGFIAQEVEEAMHSAGLTNLDFAGLTISNEIQVDAKKNETEVQVYRLRYEEFIAILTAQAQAHDKRIEALEEKLNKLLNE